MTKSSMTSANQDGAGEDGRGQHRQQHAAHCSHRRGTEVDRRLLVLLADGQQPGRHDHDRIGELERHEAGHLRRRAQCQRGADLVYEEQQRDREQRLGDDEGQQHHDVGALGQPAVPAVDTERERDTQRHRDDGRHHAEHEGCTRAV